MNRSVLVLVAILAVLGAVAVIADGIDDFVASLNQAWSQTNDTQALQIINARLASNTNDVLGLSTRMYFYVFAEGNLTNARTAADGFIAAVNASTNADLIAYAREMRDEVCGIPLDESGPYDAGQRAQLREPAASFPFIQKCVVVARWLEQ